MLKKIVPYDGCCRSVDGATLFSKVDLNYKEVMLVLKWR